MDSDTSPSSGTGAETAPQRARGRLVHMLASWLPPHIEEPKARRALWFSFFDGFFTVAMVGLLETHGVAALLSLKATDMELALLGGLPLFLSAVVQLATPFVSAHIRTRKPIIVCSVSGQVLMLILLGMCGWFKWPGVSYVFVVLYALYAMSGSFGGSVWTSWLADLVPQAIRGRMFAWRNRYFSILQVLTGVLSGYAVQALLGQEQAWTVFMGVFLCAALLRTGALLCLIKQYEPPLNYQPSPRDFTYIDFLSKAPTSNFARFTIFVALLNGGTAIAGPFFNKYYLQVLHLRYDDYALVINAHLIGTLLFLPFWGKVADHYGNWLVVRVAAIVISVIPLQYLFFTGVVPLWCFNFCAGAAWSGFGLATFNYLLDAVTPQRRVRCAAYMGATVGFSIFIFGMTGGWLVQQLPPILFWDSGYQTLFALSAAMRIVFCGIFIGFGLIREIRNVKPMSPTDIIAELPGVRLTLDFGRNIYRVLRRI